MIHQYVIINVHWTRLLQILGDMLPQTSLHWGLSPDPYFGIQINPYIVLSNKGTTTTVVNETSNIASDGGESISLRVLPKTRRDPVRPAGQAGPSVRPYDMASPMAISILMRWKKAGTRFAAPSITIYFNAEIYKRCPVYNRKPSHLIPNTADACGQPKNSSPVYVPCLVSPEWSPKWWHLQTARHRTERAARTY